MRALFQLPFPELIHRAASVHRQHFDPTEGRFRPCVRSRPAAVRKIAPIARRARNQYDTGVKAEKVIQVEKVLADSDTGAATEENCKCSFLTPFKALSCSA